MTKELSLIPSRDLVEKTREVLAAVGELQENYVELQGSYDRLECEFNDVHDRSQELEEELADKLEYSDDNHIEANLLATFEVLVGTYGYPRFRQILNDALASLQKYYG